MKKKNLLMATVLLGLALSGRAEGQRVPADAPCGIERSLTAAVIVAEAGGEGAKSMECVYEVIHTRVSQWNHGGYWGVLTRRKQFSCLNGTTPAALIAKQRSHPHYKWVHDQLLRFPPLTVHTVPGRLLALTGNRADHFHDTSVNPYWAKGEQSIRVGRMKFYRLRD